MTHFYTCVSPADPSDMFGMFRTAAEARRWRTETHPGIAHVTFESDPPNAAWKAMPQAWYLRVETPVGAETP